MNYLKNHIRGIILQKVQDADRLISDLNNFPHILVLYCVMD
jgi:hypothetical protein